MKLDSQFSIDFVCPRSPCFLDHDYECGRAGGNESTIILWARQLAGSGHTVRVYVRGIETQNIREVEWRSIDSLREGGDVLVSVRDVGPLLDSRKYLLKVLYLGDRVTDGLGLLAPDVCDFVWVNSLFHHDLVRSSIDPGIPVITGCCGYDPDLFFWSEKDEPIRFVHSSVPYRGLANVLDAWSAVKAIISDAELHITGGYRLWGYDEDAARSLLKREIDMERLSLPGIHYHGVLPKTEYAALVRSATFFIYPTTYQETCCIAALEAAAAGAVPILSSVGALKERVVHGISGYFVRAEPSDQMNLDISAALSWISSDREFMRQLSRSAAELALPYSIPSVVGLLKQSLLRAASVT